jgi:YVTN family beta-propeller protein
VGTAPSVDLLRFDERVGRLYVPHSSNATLDIVDARTAKVIGSVPGLPGIKGIALSPDPSVVYASVGGNGTVAVIDIPTLKVSKSIQVGGSPDAIEYDPTHEVIAVSTGTGKKVALIDRTLLKVIASVDLPGKPQLMTVDPSGGRVFIAINDKDEIDVVDVVSQQITTVLKGCDIKTPVGLAYDADQNRLYVANHLVMSVIDVLVDHCLGSVDIGSGTDQIAVNPHVRHIYAANAGSRNVTVIDSVTLKPIGIQGTARQAATLAVDPTTDRVYVALPLSGYIAVYHDP